jgi:hypothetical protein
MSAREAGVSTVAMLTHRLNESREQHVPSRTVGAVEVRHTPSHGGRPARAVNALWSRDKGGLRDPSRQPWMNMCFRYHSGQ